MSDISISDKQRMTETISNLLHEGYAVSVVCDCEGVYMIDYIHSEFEGEFIKKEFE